MDYFLSMKTCSERCPFIVSQHNNYYCSEDVVDESLAFPNCFGIAYPGTICGVEGAEERDSDGLEFEL